MKTTSVVGTLAAILLAAGQAHAAFLPLDNVMIAASYNGAAEGMLGWDHGFAFDAGSHITALDPTGTGGVEFLSADYLFGVDFSSSGLLTVFNNGPVPAGAYRMRFDFGNSLAKPLTSFTLLDASAIGGLPVLSMLDAHSIELDLSAVDWGMDFGMFTAQLAAEVPEPPGAPLLLAAGAALLLARRRTPV